ncbi:DUF2334 domain-containing protein [Lentimicrobium sp. S6]|uniref:DUF2334 domain-containing protein n=1 Tax=Lentimicrobium sp. S6 TaxID=2735872 RepID=UPI0015524E1B|nr:DUF2334 domain-containing protein [Lentimicrobium sp. S6]NPD46736.1 hypothetical protein [Lentimicrobium sp. S6]
MSFTKTKYFNNHHTACSLMIDDVVPAAVSEDGEIGPHNDWGYLKDSKNSLFSFLMENLLIKYPHIKGSIFLPLESHLYIPKDTKYNVFTADLDEEYIAFLKSKSEYFDIEFHGVKHTYNDGAKLVFEFENIQQQDFKYISNKLDTFEKLGLCFNGVKFPGYKYNSNALKFIENRSFFWVALEADMINRKHQDNVLKKLDKFDLINIPTNLSGDIFKPSSYIKQLKRLIKNILLHRRDNSPEKYIKYLYNNKLPITIQEHFQNQIPNGKRQTPNIYDDIESLDKIYSYLQPLDIWYASCSQIAKYYDAYINTEVYIKKYEFEIIYNGNLENSELSFVSEFSRIQDTITKKIYIGKPSKDKFVFNHIRSGKYTKFNTYDKENY